MFDYIGDKINTAFKNIRGMGRITEDNISEAMKEIRIALLEADVNYDVVKSFIKDVKEKALGMDVSKSLKPDELFIKIVKDELIELLGSEESSLATSKNPTILLLAGLQGSGKTTTAGKLALYLRKKYNKRPLLVACDIYRPAAIDQLVKLGKQIEIPVFEEGKKDVNEIIRDAKVYAKENNLNYIIIDTAGRLVIDEQLMDELYKINEEFSPDEVLLVIDSLMGQDAINVVSGFNAKLPLTGAILTKMDSEAKGGVALCIKKLIDVPIKFVGDSEKLDGLTVFNPTRMAERILGMGDILSIAEKVEDVISEEDAELQAKKLKSGKFDLNDFLTTFKQIKKLGPLENILKMLPGARNMGLNNVQVNPKDLAHIEAIILSMTPAERKNPELLKATRKQRIASGSGRSVEEVNRLLKQFDQMKDMMKKMGNGSMKMPF